MPVEADQVRIGDFNEEVERDDWVEQTLEKIESSPEPETVKQETVHMKPIVPRKQSKTKPVK